MLTRGLREQASWKSTATPYICAAPAESDEIHAQSCGVQPLRELRFRETMVKKGSDATKPLLQRRQSRSAIADAPASVPNARGRVQSRAARPPSQGGRGTLWARSRHQRRLTVGELEWLATHSTAQ